MVPSAQRGGVGDCEKRREREERREGLANISCKYQNITTLHVVDLCFLKRINSKMSSTDYLYEQFKSFAGYGATCKSEKTLLGIEVDELDSFRFAKFCKDAKLMKGDNFNLEPHDIDLIFMKAKTIKLEGAGELTPQRKASMRQSKKKINFEEFKAAIKMLAEKLDLNRKAFIAYLQRTIQAGPSVKATTTEYAKFYDDKNTWTGIYSEPVARLSFITLCFLFLTLHAHIYAVHF